MQIMKIKEVTEKELLVQEAVGSLPEEYRIPLCRHKTPKISKGVRTCHLCGLKCIKKGQEFYRHSFLNICEVCSWLSPQTIKRIVKEQRCK